MAQVLVESNDIGKLELIDSSDISKTACLQFIVQNSTGRPLVLASYADAGGPSHRQELEVPLSVRLLVGSEYRLTVSKTSQCASRSLALRVAMSTLWKYPREYGRLSIDSRTSIGSLWARID
jgi:hypothetical protein